MTEDLDETYGVSIVRKQASGGYFLAEGRVFERRTVFGTVATVSGEGRTPQAATERALAEARRRVRALAAKSR